MATTSPAPEVYSAAKTFDDVGPAYESAFEGLPTQAASIKWLLSQLSSKPAQILDLGCGTGRPVCSTLADAGHNVLGIDISGAMIQAAKSRVPNARFQQVDFREFSAEPGSYDAVTVFFSLIAGVTQEDIKGAFRSAYGWLRPGGLFLFATVPIAGENLEIKWMGHPVVVSSLSAEDVLANIKKVGFEVVHSETSVFTPNAVKAGICQAEDVWEETHLFVYARKGGA